MTRKEETTPREPKPGEWMTPLEFQSVIRLTPLVAIDLIVRSPDSKVLLGRRTFEPAKDRLFVPGGRITKNETRAAAFQRISREELGITLAIEQARLMMVNDHIYPTNRFELPGFGTHYVTLGYEIELTVQTSSLPKDQHAHYLWMTPAELLTSPDVHENTKAYFR